MNNELEDQLVKMVDAVKNLLDLPYPAEVGLSQVDDCIYGVNNFFRDGPFRKGQLIYSTGGDFEYETAEEIDEDGQEQEHLAIFNFTRERLASTLQEYIAYDGYHPPDLDICENYQDLAKEDESCPGEEGVDWSPSYQGGAAFPDQIVQEIIWDLGSDYLLLSIGRTDGDGNFRLYTFTTLTPKLQEDGQQKEIPSSSILKADVLLVEDEYRFFRFGLETDPSPITHAQVKLFGSNEIPEKLYQAQLLEELSISAYKSLKGDPCLYRFPHLKVLTVFLEGQRLYPNEIPEKVDAQFIQELLKRPLPNVTHLSLSTYSPFLSLDDLKRVSSWEKLEVFELEYVALILSQEELEEFAKLLHGSSIQEIWFTEKGSLELEERKDEKGKILSSYFPGINVTWY